MISRTERQGTTLNVEQSRRLTVISPIEIAKTKDLEAEIVIIGGGGAGLAAAVAAVEKGATDIIVLEKLGHVGGNAALSLSIFAAESPVKSERRLLPTGMTFLRRL